MNEEAKSDYCYWNVSRVVRDSLAAVPLRPSNTKPNVHNRGRKYYNPWFVSGRNSASNVGIAHILTQIFEAYQELHHRGKYGYVKMDVNLFLKYFQVFILFFDFDFRSFGLQRASSIQIVSIWCLLWNTFILSNTVLRRFGRKSLSSNRSLLLLSMFMHLIVVFVGQRNFNRFFERMIQRAFRWKLLSL